MPEFTAKAVQADKNDPGSWYVFWESRHAYGARGASMTFEKAAALADRMMAGGVWDAA